MERKVGVQQACVGFMQDSLQLSHTVHIENLQISALQYVTSDLYINHIFTKPKICHPNIITQDGGKSTVVNNEIFTVNIVHKN